MRRTPKHRCILVSTLFAVLGSAWCATSAAEGSFPGLTAATAPVALSEVVINVPAGELTLLQGGQAVATYPVTVGTPSYPTPMGEFTLQRAIWNPWWRPPNRGWTRGRGPQAPGPNNAMGRVKIYFKPLYFLHGTAETEDLGEPASHGCVRLSNDDIIDLARRSTSTPRRTSTRGSSTPWRPTPARRRRSASTTRYRCASSTSAS